MFKDRSGFTLVEVLASAAITAILVGAIGALLAGSFKIAQLLDARKDARLETALFALEEMASELQRVPLSRTGPFEAGPEQISFYRSDSGASQDPYAADFRLGQTQQVTTGQLFVLQRVFYVFDASQKALIRRTEGGEERMLAGELADAVFSYAVMDPPGLEEGAWEWKERLSADEDVRRLKAIRVRLEFGKDARRYTLRGVEKTFLVLNDVR